MLAKGNFNHANQIFVKKKTMLETTKEALKKRIVYITLFIVKKCIWLYETVPSGEPP